MKRSLKGRRGFTLIELMIVVAILAIIGFALANVLGEGCGGRDDSFVSERIIQEYPGVVEVVSIDDSGWGAVKVKVKVRFPKTDKITVQTYCFERDDFEEYDLDDRVPCD